MSTTTSLTNMNFAQVMINSIIDDIDIVMEWLANLFWQSITNFVLENWQLIVIIYCSLLITAIIKLLKGRWGMFGSIIYHTLYFGILFIVGLIKGPTVFINNYFEVFCAIILYPLCYFITGKILNRFKF